MKHRYNLRTSPYLLVFGVIFTLLLIFISAMPRDRLRLIRADRLEQYMRKNVQEKKLTGDVVFQKGDVNLKCELAYWREKEERADFFKNVVVTKKSQTLTADTLTYFSSSDIILARGRTQLTEEERVLKADKMKYYVSDESSEASGNVSLKDNYRDVYAEHIKYLSKDKKAIATKNAFIIDRDRRTKLQADSIVYYYESGDIEATQNPLLIRHDSTGTESFSISGDIIKGHEDEGKFHAVGNVKIWREDFTAFCEEVIYDDESESAVLTGNPKVLHRDQELTGDEMVLSLKNEVLSSLFINQNAKAISVAKAYLPADESDSIATVQPETIKVRDEITGKSMEIYFKNGKTDSIRVSSMASSYYNILEDSIMQGMNITSGDSIIMVFDEEKLMLITVIGGTQGKFIPHETNTKVDTTVIYSSEQIDYWIVTKITNLTGKSSLKYGDASLTAGMISIEWDKNLLYASPIVESPYDSIPGNLPTLEQRGQEPISGDDMVYNMKTQKGRIVQGKTKVQDGFYYGERIKKEEKEVFFVSHGIYTTCDLTEKPHYYFKSKHMKLIQKDKIIARPIVLYIHDIPILGLPFGIFPSKGGRRHSGWIMPSYGENKRVGGFIKGMGYFWAPDDYFDFRLTSDFFDKRGIILNHRTRYVLRYKFSGSIEGSYTNEFFSDSPKKKWSLNINHSHTISPTMRLSANGRFVSDDVYYREFGINRETRLNQQLISNATLSKNWPGTPYSLSMNFNQTHNLQAKTRIASPPSEENQKIKYVYRSLPNISFSRSQKPIIPLKKGRDVSRTKWYNSIYFSVRSNLKNKQDINYVSSLYDADTLFWQKEDVSKNAITHDISLSSSQTMLGWLTLNQSISINEGWLFEYDQPLIENGYFIIDENGIIQTKKISGFKARHTGSASLNAQTKIYGLFPIRIGSLQAVRHVITPRIGLRYVPDFTKPIFGWDPGYVKSGIDTAGFIRTFDPFRLSLLGSTPSYVQKSLTINIGNIFQAKSIQDDKEKKIDLFTLNLSTSHNFAADSLRWAPINSTLRTKVTKKLAISLNASHDLYAYKNRRINSWHKSWYGIPIPRMTRLSASTSFSLKGKRFGIHATIPTAADTSDTLITEIINPSYGYNEETNISKPTPKKEELWTANFNFRYSMSQIPKSESFWMSLNFKVNLTSKWELNYRANLDPIQKKIISQDFSVNRDLHCWQLSFSWTPSGYGKQYYLTINVKSPTLRDLKYEERGGRRSTYGF